MWVPCPNCSRNMGTLARFCNSCGAAMLEITDPETLAEIADRQKDEAEYFENGRCTPYRHEIVAGIGRLKRKQRGFCPDCGKNLEWPKTTQPRPLVELFYIGLGLLFFALALWFLVECF